jgi:hypothetical protein
MINVWIVRVNERQSTRVTADGFQIGPNGDLLFVNRATSYGSESFDPVRAFAAGSWVEVEPYS